MRAAAGRTCARCSATYVSVACRRGRARGGARRRRRQATEPRGVAFMGHFHGPRCRSRGTPRQRTQRPSTGGGGEARARLGARGGPGTCRCSQRERGHGKHARQGENAQARCASRTTCIVVAADTAGGTGVHTALPKGYEHELFHIASARGMEMRRGARTRALFDHSGCWAVYLKAVQRGGGAALRSARTGRGGPARTAQRAARCLGLWCTHTAGDVLATHSLRRASMVWNACALLRSHPCSKSGSGGCPGPPLPISHVYPHHQQV